MNQETLETVMFRDNLVQFSSSLYDVLDKTDSICVSPYSVTAALLLLMIGARGGSKDEILSALFKKPNSFTEQEILKNYKSLTDDIINRAGNDVVLSVANRLFVSKKVTVLRRVRIKAKKYFGADISLKDFTKPQISAALMNRWVSKQTNNKIKDLIKEDWLNDLTIMFIINAVYFKATWVDQFDPKQTTKADFYVSKAKTIQVDMMNLRIYTSYKTASTFSAISLPFEGRNFEMVFILPHEKDGLSEVEAMIRANPDFMKDLMNDAVRNLTHLSIPKFTVESEINLKQVLPKIGIQEIFNPFKADFSRLIKERIDDIYVRYAVQKVFFSINEAGAEGAAGTAAGLFVKSEFTRFVANHPFLFCIRDRKSGIILFFGRYQPK